MLPEASSLFFPRVVVFGVGLLGGSFARAIRRQKLASTIIGCGRTESGLRRAKDLGIIDFWTTEPSDAVLDADLVLLATPVPSFSAIVSRFRSSLKPGSLVTDVGSVKGPLVGSLESLMPEGVHYVGSHPIAGGEASGCEAASADLFDGARCILTPTAATDPESLVTITALWRALGMETVQMSPERHDEIYAMVSHFPHVAAYALVNTVAGTDALALAFAGSGFRDATRIALSPPELWQGIVLANRDSVLKSARQFRQELDRIIAALELQDATALEVLFSRAQLARRALPDRTRDEE